MMKLLKSVPIWGWAILAALIILPFLGWRAALGRLKDARLEVDALSRKADDTAKAAERLQRSESERAEIERVRAEQGAPIDAQIEKRQTEYDDRREVLDGHVARTTTAAGEAKRRMQEREAKIQAEKNGHSPKENP